MTRQVRPTFPISKKLSAVLQSSSLKLLPDLILNRRYQELYHLLAPHLRWFQTMNSHVPW